MISGLADGCVVDTKSEKTGKFTGASVEAGSLALLILSGLTGGGGRFGGGLGLQIASVSLPLVCHTGPAGVRLLGRPATPPHLPPLCNRLGPALRAPALPYIGQ